nr:T9SS type A sorting domain-containing protein [uncultured Chitinophaga sp.]
MKSLFILCFVFFSSTSMHAQVIGYTRVCPDVEYNYSYNSGVLTPSSISYSVIEGMGVVIPTGVTCRIKFPNDQNAGKKPRVIADITWSNGEKKRDTSQPITVLALGNPSESASITRSFPCSFRGNTTITFDSVANANVYEVSNDAGWPVTRVSAKQFSININNGAEGKVALLVRNDTCKKARASWVAISRFKPQPGAITGTGPICDGTASVFSIPTYPDATSYTWVAGHPNIRINGQPSPVTITGTSGSSVQITSTGGNYADVINVVANSICGTSDTTRQSITAGILPMSRIGGFEENGMHFAAGETYPFYIDFPTNPGPILEVAWTVNGGTILNPGPNKDIISVRMNKPRVQPLPGALYMSVKYRNQCGWSSPLTRTGDLDVNGPAFTVSPNPAASYLNIHLTNNGPAERKTIAASADGVVILYDLYYKEIKRMKLASGTQQFMMNVQGVKEGTYILQIIIGKEKSTSTVVISHSL